MQCSSSDNVFALLIQVKVSGRPRGLANGTRSKEDTRPGSENPDANGSAECSTSYHEAEDISRANFKAIGTGFQVAPPPARTLDAAVVAQMAFLTSGSVNTWNGRGKACLVLLCEIHALHMSNIKRWLDLMQAVLVNQGWEGKHASSKAVVARLAKLPMTQLCPTGFIFIWVDKTHVRHGRAAFLISSASVVHAMVTKSVAGHPACCVQPILSPELCITAFGCLLDLHW